MSSRVPLQAAILLPALFVLIGAACLPVAAAGAAPEPPDPNRPLSNEDIVRMTAGGMSPSRIIQAIEQARAVAFDLDPDILIELRRARVVDPVIEAMKEAARRAPPSASPLPAEAAEAAPAHLEIRFDRPADRGDAEGTAAIRSRDGKGRELSLAFFVYCLEPTHAPDLWQTKSPLGESFPRHHILYYLDRNGSIGRPDSAGRPGGVFLALPAEPVTVDTEPGTHVITVGVAARAGGDWLPLASSDGRLQTVAGATSRLVVRLKTRGSFNRPPRSGSMHICEIVRIESPPVPEAAPPSTEGS
ncbi:MAG TPA: hypothetical protein VFP98_08240 [Candidatus Polarisedimenticolia bacterium]|nr:hypothetical protein [Candidatus Polarisedimenticolia bacterium]